MKSTGAQENFEVCAIPYPDISLDEKLSQSASTIHFIMQDLQFFS